MTTQEAIDKARKLLALAASNTNPNEAATAAARAQEILDRHKLSAAMLEAEDPTIKEAVDFGEPLDEMKKVSTWKWSLAKSIADANSCRVYISLSGMVIAGEMKSAIKIVGRPSDVAKTKYLYLYLVSETDRLTKVNGKGKGKTWCNNYRLGINDAVHERLNGVMTTIVESMKESSIDSEKVDQALMVIDNHKNEVDRFVKEYVGNMRSVKAPFRGDGNARQTGYQHGQKIALNGASGALGSGQDHLKG